MKKIFNLLFVCTFILVFTCSCDSISIEGNKNDENLSLSEKIENNYEMYIKNLVCNDLSNDDVMYMDYSYFVLENGKVYTYTRLQDKFYSNDEQCIEVDTDITLTKHIDWNYFKGTDNKIYIINSDGIHKINETEKLSSYTVDDDLSKDENVIRYFKSKFDNEEYAGDWRYVKYYVLETDGNIYEEIYHYTQNSVWDEYENISKEIYISKDKYGKIIDFMVNDNGEISKIITKNNFYNLQEVKTEECEKYIDIACSKELIKNDVYSKHVDEIKYINNNLTLLKDNSIIYTEYFYNAY